MLDFVKCCGCGACSAVCSKDCIDIKKDDLGFNVASMSKNADCINCNLCNKVCPITLKQDSGEIIKVYCGQNLVSDELIQSTSGGIFSILARYILRQGGSIWGVEMSPDWETVFTCISSEDQLQRIRGSKYVEVAEPLPYKTIAKQLIAGEKVLFSGTPCQVNALSLYLKATKCKYAKNQLILVDLFCYGIQSPYVWKKYISEVNSNNKKMKKISMRKKYPSWEIYSMNIEFEDGSIYQKSRWKDLYLKSYSKGLFNRETCAECTSKAFPKLSDLTLGDFWNVDGFELSNIFDIDRGISIIIANSIIGVDVVEAIKSEMKSQEIDLLTLKRLYPHLGRANKASNQRDVFIEELKSSQFSKTVNKYVGMELKKQIRFQIKPIRRRVKKLIKR